MAGRTAFFLIAALALGPSSIEAQTPCLPTPVRVETLVSARVGEPREFWVSLPDRYNDSTEKYPVIYMMDGDFNFNSGVIGGVRQAAWLGEIPEFIIVGIKNTNRSKDIFPEEVTYPDGSTDGGRANQYLDFVRDELIPRVAKTYRTTDYRTFGNVNAIEEVRMYGVELLNVRQCESVLHECDGLLRSQRSRLKLAELISSGVERVDQIGFTNEKMRVRARARLANDILPRLAALTDWRQALTDRMKVVVREAF